MSHHRPVDACIHSGVLTPAAASCRAPPACVLSHACILFWCSWHFGRSQRQNHESLQSVPASLRGRPAFAGCSSEELWHLVKTLSSARAVSHSAPVVSSPLEAWGAAAFVDPRAWFRGWWFPSLLLPFRCYSPWLLTRTHAADCGVILEREKKNRFVSGFNVITHTLTHSQTLTHHIVWKKNKTKKNKQRLLFVVGCSRQTMLIIIKGIIIYYINSGEARL